MIDPAITAEIARRMDELRARPELLARFDVDRSGSLDPSEWRLIERIVTVEVAQGIARSLGELVDADAPTRLRDGRYEITGLLGVGGQGRTWLATDTTTDTAVAIKEMAMATALDWKAVELFERETKVLESLDHPAIPRYVDAFHVDSLSGVRFFLVQEFVDGTALDTEMESRRYDEAESLALLRQACEILVYLHGLTPPVIHRDLKPSNLMRRRDGSLALIDFGAVSTVNPDLTGGSTIVGTNGYMPIEQFMGRAEPRTDLYALGATVVHLLSCTHPAELPVERSRIQFEDRVDLGDAAAELLGDLVAPIVDDRPASAQDVIDRIDAILEPPTVEPAPTGVQADLDALLSGREGALIVAPPTDMVPKPDAAMADAPDTPIAVHRSARLAGGISSMMTLVVFVGLIQVAGFTFSRCGAHDQAMDALATCPSAVDAIGENPRQSLVGCSCGNAEFNGCGSSQSGFANATMPVEGELGRGRFQYNTSISGGVATVTSARLRVDGNWTTVVPCQGGTVGAVLQCDDTTCRTSGDGLADDLDDSLRWDPCDGGPFTYRADIDFESCCDYLAVGPIEHTGYDAKIEGIAPGATTLRVHTDGSVTSGGVRLLEATCLDDMPSSPHIACSGTTCQTPISPLPHDLEAWTAWDPCDGQPFSFTGRIHFEQCCDAIVIDGVDYTGRDADIQGSALGATAVVVRTDASVDSEGIRSLEATCGVSSTSRHVSCTDRQCTTRGPLPNNAADSVVWDPCDGGGFRYNGRVDTEACCDFVRIDAQSYSGDSTFRGSAEGPVRVSIETDSSVPSHGLRRLVATCD